VSAYGAALGGAVAGAGDRVFSFVQKCDVQGIVITGVKG